MVEGLLLVLAFAVNVGGMGLLALTLEPHWDQVRAPLPYPAARTHTLRRLGAAALGCSLALCLVIDEPSLAPLAWVMALTLSALLVAVTLAYRPRWLSWLVAWVR